MPKCDFNKATLLKSHFSMGVLLQICCIFSEHLFLRTPLDGYFRRVQNHGDIKNKSRIAETSKLEHLVIIVNGFQLLIIITKCSMLDAEAFLDPPLEMLENI